MSDTEIMEFPYGMFLKVRLEFVLLRDNELEAKIMRIIENWMIDQKKDWMSACAQAASDGKQEPPEPDYFVTLSYAQIIAQLYMFNSSRKGEGKEVIEGKENSISRRTVSKAMQALIDDKVVFTRPNPKQTKEYDAAQYKLNCPLVQEQMKRLPKNPMSYLGSNGRVDGRPCENFAHPPCENNSHPMRNNFTSPCENSASGDVQKNHILIDYSNRLGNRDSEEGTYESDPKTDSTQMGTPSLIPSSTPSLSLDVDNSVDNQPSSEQDDTQPLIAKETTSTQPFMSKLSPMEQARQDDTDLAQLNKRAAEIERQNGESNSVESLTTRNDSQTYNCMIQQELSLTAEEQDPYDLWCQMPFIKVPPRITATVKKHCKTLAPHVKTLEDMMSLEAFARKEHKLTDDVLTQLGNLTNPNCLNGWLRKKSPTPVISFQEKKQQVKTRKQAQEEWTASLLADPWK